MFSKRHTAEIFEELVKLTPDFPPQGLFCLNHLKSRIRKNVPGDVFLTGPAVLLNFTKT